MKAYRKLVSGLVLLALIAAPILVVANAQAIGDWWKLRDYIPLASIAKLANSDTMTEKGQRLFYVNHPELIIDKAAFRDACPLSEQTIVLGCYYHIEKSFTDGIAILDVQDARLQGVEEVTAAHEMLHSAYQRLSGREKEQINNMLVDYYNNSLKDPRIIATIESYKKTEPKDVVNEMHSVFGTEATDLPKPLEDYYKKYFNDRRVITNFSDQYESVFAQNKQQLDSLKGQIETLKSQLGPDKATIETEQDALQAESRRMQGLLSSGKVEQYNSSVAAYNARIARLRTLISDYNAKVNQVNSLVEQYNALAYTQESLYDSIDTRLQTQTVQ